MAQTGYTPILIYSSSTVSQAPSAGNLTNSTLGSELAINITDGKLFYKDSGGSVQVIAWKVTPTTAGGTGLTSYTAGDLLYYASGTTFTKLAIGATGRWLGSSGTAPQWNAPAALTKTDDTNVTLTLGGNASTALLNAASLTLGWTGQLAVTRGGTGLSTVAQGDILYGSAANTLASLAKNTTATRYLSNTGSSNNPAWAQVDLTNGVTGTLPVANGGSGTATQFTAGSVIFAGTNGVYSQDNSNLFWDDTNNRFGIGNTSPPAPLSVKNAGECDEYDRNTAADGTISRWKKQGATIAYFNTNAYALPSDAKVKRNIESIEYGLAFVNALRPVQYNTIFQDQAKLSRKSFGLIAQEVEQSLKSFGKTLDDVTFLERIEPQTEKDSEYGLAYASLIPVLVKAVQELQQQINELKGA